MFYELQSHMDWDSTHAMKQRIIVLSKENAKYKQELEDSQYELQQAQEIAGKAMQNKELQPQWKKQIGESARIVVFQKDRQYLANNEFWKKNHRYVERLLGEEGLNMKSEDQPYYYIDARKAIAKAINTKQQNLVKMVKEYCRGKVLIGQNWCVLPISIAALTRTLAPPLPSRIVGRVPRILRAQCPRQ